MRRSKQLNERKSAVRELKFLAIAGILLVIGASATAMTIAEDRNQDNGAPIKTDQPT